MKRKFTLLIAALALLTMIVQPGRAWGQGTTVTQTGFTSVSGTSLNGNSTISFTSYKGGGTSNPAINGSSIRLYQNANGNTAGYIVIGVSNSYVITRASITTSSATTAGYKLSDTDPGDSTPVKNTFNESDHDCTNGGEYEVNDISSQYIIFANFGTTKNQRLDISAISVTYESSGGGQTTTYTVTYHSNVTGNDETIEVVYNEGADVTVAANTFTNSGYAFTEWNEDAEGNGQSYNPDDVIEDIASDIDLYAQWEESSEATATLTATNLELTGSYNDSDDTEITIDGITYIHTDLMKNSNNIQAKASSGTIKNTTAYPGDITSVVITHSGTARATTINGSADGTNWTQVATGDGSINANFSGRGYKYFQITRGSNAAYWTKIEVTYSTGGGGSQTASNLAITGAPVALSFDLYNNSSAQTVSYTTSSTGDITITPASPTSYFSYMHDAEHKTITVTPIAVTPSAQTVTISQEADATYYAGTATFTVSVADSSPIANIATLTAITNAGNYAVALTDAVVTYVSGNNAYIQDASGAVAMYKSGHGLTAGDVLNGTANVTYQLHNGNPQITDLTGVTPASGTAPNPTEVAQSDWSYTFSNVLSQYFKVTGATITLNNNKYYVSLGGESVQLYKPGSSISELDLTKTYSITGFPTLYNTTKELTIYADPEVEASPDPSITVADATVNVPAGGSEGTLTVTYENITEIAAEVYFCTAQGAEATYDWITAEINNDNNVEYLVEPNEGEARTAYFKVYALDDNTEDVYSNLVTVSQDEAPTYAALPFSFDEGKNAIATTDGLYQDGLGDDYSSSPKLRFDDTGDWLLLQFNERPGTLTFKVKGNPASSVWAGTFTVQTSTNGETFTDFVSYDDLTSTVATKTIDNLGANVRYIKWTYTKTSGNVALGDIHLYKYVAPEPEITLEEYSIAALATGLEGNLEVTYVNYENPDDILSEVWFCNEDGTAAVEYEWITAEIDDKNVTNLYYIIGTNTDNVERKAYFKVYEASEDIYSDLVTVTQAAPVIPEPSITVAPQSVEATAAETQGNMNITISNMTISDAGQLSADFCNATGGDIDPKPDWIDNFEFQLNENVFTGTYRIQTNTTTEQRTAYFKVTGYADGDTNEENPVYSNVVTVTQAAGSTPSNPYIRIDNLSSLTDGSKVIIAARYDDEHTTGYYAMPGETSGKPTGVLFTSETSGDNEILPAAITNSEDTYCWTVNVTENGYTFTNAENHMIGYTSSTNFATDGNNTEWTIATGTAAETAMVAEYTGFVITNVNNNTRAFALNNNQQFGPYATSNIANVGYNFYLDFFVQAVPSIAINPGPYNLNCDGGDNVLPVTYKNMPADPQASVVFYESNGETELTENPSWISATINGENNVAGHIDANETSDARTAYFKVKGIDANGDDVFSELVTINQAAYTLSIVFTTTELNIEVGGETDRKISFNYSGLGSNPSFEVRRYESDGTTPADYDWLTTSINNDKVYITVLANPGDARHAYFKVYGENGTTHTESNLVTINQNGLYTISFYVNGQEDKSIKITSIIPGESVDHLPATSNITPVGFEIVGWSETNNSTEAVEEPYTPTASCTLYAIMQMEDAPVVTCYEKVTSALTDWSGDYLIVYEDGNVAFDGSLEILDAAQNTIGVTIANNKITANATTNASMFTITAFNDGYSIRGASGKYIGNATNSNGLTSSDDPLKNTISYENNTMYIISSGGAYMRYNSSSGQERFRYFKSGTYTSQQAIQLYKKTTEVPASFNTIVNVSESTEFTSDILATELVVVEPNAVLTFNHTNEGTAANIIIKDGGQLVHTGDVPATLLKDYEAAPWPSSKSVSGWYTIASPVDGGDLSAVVSNVTNYDFFAYDEANYIWRNQKVPANNINAFEQGIGYLYATAAAKQGSFAGTMKATNATIEKDLSYACTLESLKGFNLMGNPFTRNLTSADVELGGVELTNYYVVEGGSELEVRNIATYPIKPGQGFMVQATAENQQLVFNPGTGKGRSANNGNISIAVSNESFNDMAYINIANGNTLRKMTLNADSPKVYVMNDNKDYAAARVESLSGSMPVCFKTNNIGSYTITVKANELDVEYLHLIDNVTHEDIDLLFDSSYSFVASGHDNAARFTLVFRANANIDELEVSDSFAYQSGDVIIVNGEGTLQVFDVMGRFVRSININGSESINASEFSTGVYVFRMVGNDVKAQKVVIR